MQRVVALLVVLAVVVAVWSAGSRSAGSHGGDGVRSEAPPVAPATRDAPPRVPAPRAGRPGDPAGAVAEGTASATVVGRVTAVGGVSTSNAAVRLTPDGVEDRSVVVRCGADGWYHAEGLAPGRWRVVVAGGGFATRLDLPGTEARFVDLRAGDEVLVDLEVTPLAVVSGAVTDADGRPVAGARVRILCAAFLHASGVWTLEATTGEDGRFERSGVTPGDSVQVEVVCERHPRWTRWMRHVPAGERTEVDVRLARGVAFELVLTSAADGSPVRDALVWVQDAETRDLLADDGIRSDAAGRVALVVAEGRAIGLQIDATDFVALPFRVVPASEVRVGPVTIRMVPALAIAGRVVLADGRPAAGAELEVGPRGDPTRGALDGDSRRATADADGRFRVAGLRAGPWTVAVLGSGWTPVHEADAEAGAAEVEIRLPEGLVPLREVRVTVVGAEAAPIHRVRHMDGVHVEGALVRGGGGAPGPAEVRIAVAPESGATSFFEAWDARDASGGRLPLGHVLVDVPDDVPASWTVELPPERSVEGRVVDADGRGVAAATVVVSSGILGRAFSRIATATAASDGAFRVGGLGDGEYVLEASAPGRLPATAVADGGATGVEIRLADGLEVRVRVVDADGAPVPRALVVATVSEGPDEHETNPTFEAPPTDSAGRTVLPGVARGVPHDLRVLVPVFGHEDGFFRRDVEDWIPADVEIRLERRTRITGVVRRADGSPFPGCVVDVSGDGAAEARVVHGPEPGAFVVRDLRAGSPVRLRASAGAAVSPEVVAEPGRPDVDLVLDLQAWFAVCVEGSGARSIDAETGERGVAVRWFPGGGVVRADGESRAVGGLDPRVRYTVVAGPTADGRCAEVREVVPDGRTVTLALDPGRPIAGRFGGLVPPGRGPCRVEATRDGVVVASTWAGSDGRFRLPGLPAGRWTLRAVSRDTGAVLASGECEAGDEDVSITAGGR